MHHHRILQLSLLLPSLIGCGADNGESSGGAGLGGMSAIGGAGGALTNNGGTTNASGGSSIPPFGGSTSTPVALDSPYAGKLVINELCPSNKTGPMDEAGAYPDWIELYNRSGEGINLSGFYLTDSSDEPTKSPLATSLSIKAGSVLLLWADGDAAEQGDLHTTFSLAAGGETILLLDPDQKVVDSVEWTGAAPDAAYSRLPDGTGSFAWCSKGTPNRVNGSSCPQ